MAKRLPCEPFALILFITKAKPDLCLALSSRPGVGLSQAFHGFLQSLQPTPVTSFLPFFPQYLCQCCVANQPIIHHDSSVGMATRQKLSGPCSNPGRGKRLFFFNGQTVCGAQLASYWMVPSFLPDGKADGVKLTNHYHSVPTLRISGAVLQLPLHNFMLWTGTSLHFINCHFYSLSYILKVLFHKTGINKRK